MDVLLTCADGIVRLETRAQALARARRLASRIARPGTPVVDEFLAGCEPVPHHRLTSSLLGFRAEDGDAGGVGLLQHFVAVEEQGAAGVEG